MDLENFPTCQTSQEMMDTISKEFYSDAYIAKWLFQVMGMELEDAKTMFEELRLQIFPETSTWGMRYHEEKYGIQANESLSLEDRRKAVLLKRSMRLPMNPTRLEKLLKEQIGVDVSIIEVYASYVFKVVLHSIDFDMDMNAIRKTIYSVKPSHLSYDYIFDYILMEWKERMQLEAVDFSFSFSWLKPLLTGYLLDGTWYLDGSVVLSNLGIDLMPVTMEYVLNIRENEVFDDVMIHTRSIDLWYLDGSVRLNGSKKLVMDRKEVL